MPELPEVETTVRGLERILPGLLITDVWTDYRSSFHAGKNNIKNPNFFTRFRREVTGCKVTSVSRRAKNVLIHLENIHKNGQKKYDGENTGKTILIHMKMTGHLLYGFYRKVIPQKLSSSSNLSGLSDSYSATSATESNKKGASTMIKKADPRSWENETWIPVTDAAGKNPEKLRDPFNKFIHFVISLSNGKHLAFSDMRKFAKVTLITTTELNKSIDLIDIGPEPLTPEFTFNIFKNRLGKRPNGLIKQVLMDQKILAGIGNIYSDEILWYSGVHPKSRTGNIPHTQLRKMYFEMQRILRRSIELGGDSMSDFRNLAGEKGGFHLHHAVYMQHNKACTKAFCTKIFRQSAGKQAVILKIRIGQRSAHFCPIHQKLF